MYSRAFRSSGLRKVKSINASTGRGRWTPSQATGESHAAIVCVRDQRGQMSLLDSRAPHLSPWTGSPPGPLKPVDDGLFVWKIVAIVM